MPAQNFLSFNAVEYSYPSSVEPVLKNISFDLHRGWTGIVGMNGAGKTTLLLLAAGLLQPGAGSVKKPDNILYCPQRTDDLPEGWEDFFSSADNETGALCSRLRIEYDWPYRWDSLSHGERKRLQLAVALSRNPAMLAVDEPTNHLDRDAKTLIADALAGYTGIGLLVSHDRGLLDRLCNSCLFLDTGGATLRPGGVTQGMGEADREQLEQGRVREQIQHERKRLAAEADKQRRDVEGARNRLSKKNAGAKDSDTRAKIYLAKLTGKDAVGANLYKRMETRIGRLDRELDAKGMASSSQAKRKTGVTMETAASRADRIFLLEPGSIVLGESAAGDRRLSFPELGMGALDRVALIGPNGSGKSTLIRRILENVPPSISLFYLPQELTEAESRAVLDQIYEEDEKSRGEILSRFSRLGSDPKNILQSALPSPGEVRKLLIARAVFHNPAFIVMDEPTNHLDLKSVLLLEEMLRECLCALLLVSHDGAFLSALTEKEWTISNSALTL
ncbi:ABC transporter ATP-binding protein [Spirochaetia bacterium]|nr:ABC transporter ATP-binding protein [Spirochaetia bacterium]